MGIEVRDDMRPELGYFYRADHLELARIGIPVAYLGAGIKVIGKPPGFGKEKEQEYNDHDYHQVTDTIKDDWDPAGATQEIQLLFRIGYAVAEGEDFPHWYPGAEFKVTRDAMFAQPVSAR